jgi:hypothetical protein
VEQGELGRAVTDAGNSGELKPKDHIVNGLLDPQTPASELRLRMGEIDGDQILAVRAAIGWANRVAMAHLAGSPADAIPVEAG